jgi:hypothetical protein
VDAGSAVGHAPTVHVDHMWSVTAHVLVSAAADVPHQHVEAAYNTGSKAMPVCLLTDCMRELLVVAAADVPHQHFEAVARGDSATRDMSSMYASA